MTLCVVLGFGACVLEVPVLCFNLQRLLHKNAVFSVLQIYSGIIWAMPMASLHVLGFLASDKPRAMSRCLSEMWFLDSMHC
jgi:hypothetical protein